MFRNKRAVMFVLTAVMAISAAIFFSLPKAEAAGTITILIDGTFFQPPDAQPFIANDRVMVPFRPIAEAMGATANWDETQQKVSISLANKSLEFVIGSTTMNLATTDVSGGVIRTNVTLDSPAILVNNNRAFVPIRALTEGLGATVQWVAESQTVIITSNIVRATPTPTMTPTPAINPAFATTDNFEVISGRRAQDMNDYNNHEVLFYFDSSDTNAVNSMNYIMQAARNSNAKVWGIDVRTSTGLDSLKWVYSYTGGSSQGPVLLFLYSRDKVIPLTTLNDQNLLNTMFQNWYRNYYSNVALSPTPTPTPTGTLTPSPIASFSSPFVQASKRDALDMFDYGDRYGYGNRFVLLYFDSSRSDFDQSKLDTAMQAVYDADERVYYMDDANEQDYTWFGTDEFGRTDRIPNPCLFFVDNSFVSQTEYSFRSYPNISDMIYRFLNDY